MTKFCLIDIKNNSEIIISENEFVIGRHLFQNCNDKRISRKHANIKVTDNVLKITATHTNPIFFKPKDDSQMQIIPKDSEINVIIDDLIGFLPDEFWFRVSRTLDGGNASENGQDVTANVAMFRIRNINEINSSNVNAICELNEPPSIPVDLEDNNMNGETNKRKVPDWLVKISPAKRQKSNDDEGMLVAETIKIKEEILSQDEIPREPLSVGGPLPTTSTTTDSELVKIKDEVLSHGEILPQSSAMEVEVPSTSTDNINQSVNINGSSLNNENQSDNDATTALTSELEAVPPIVESVQPTSELTSTINENSQATPELTSTTSVDPQPTTELTSTTNANPQTNISTSCDQSSDSESSCPGQPSTSTGPSSSTTPKKNIPNNNKKVKIAPADSSESNLRDSCQYGIRCYRKNPIHRSELAHPGDSDYRRPTFPPAPPGSPDCPFGALCYRRNPSHFNDYTHPPSTDPKKNRSRRRRAVNKQAAKTPNQPAKRKRPPVKYVVDDDSLDDYDLDDPFIDDDDTDDEYEPSSSEEEGEIESSAPTTEFDTEE